ncbi:ADO1 [Candida oxycetoniae]|uniref:Adenosine kinase n=1 Tax=Candida oxycetoniae TaxID=497107 RepID=A0AAI9SY93_9ASCO|nr:ADO1 [Candida oxycetoniae]KAI3404961.1 ADO1 [Candida oxycetoniae]
MSLVCLGNPLLDLQLNVSEEYLKKYDLKENDAILAEAKHLPIYDEIIGEKDLILVAGGAAQNTARGAQYLLPPNSVIYFGSVGNDVYAERLNEANVVYGLTTRYQIQKDYATGKCAALITNHSRSLVTDLAAADHFTPDHLQKPENWTLVENATHYYIGGFHLTVSPEAIKLLGEEAVSKGKPLALNFSAPFIAQFFKDQLDSVLPYVDYVIANESEAEAYAQSHDLNTKDVAEIAKHVAKLPKKSKLPRVVIFTQGTDPTIVVSSEDLQVKQYPVKPLAKEKIVDTNGAGDAFAAGFMASLVEGKELAEAIDVGQWTAALSIQQVGPTFPFPKEKYNKEEN